MDRVTVYHNPHCRSSVTGLELARALAGEANVDVVLYMKQPPDRAALERLVAILDGPVTELVRRDAEFARQGLAEDDVQAPADVVEVLLRRPRLLQRPVVVRGDRAVVGRPKERIAALLG